MTRNLPLTLVYIVILSTFLQQRQIHCLRRLMRRKLASEDIGKRMTSDDIRNLVSSSLASNNPRTIENNKRDTLSDQDVASIDNQAEDNVAVESKDTSIYDDEVDGDDGDQQIDNSEYKRSADASLNADISEGDQSDLATYDEPDVKEVKDVAKREAKSEEDYDEEIDNNFNAPEASISDDRKNPRAALPENNEEPQKHVKQREVSVESNSDLDYEEIENQIQQRIDSIKEDIKREIEEKQRVREIEANNARFDELEYNRDNEDVDNSEVVNDVDSSKIFSRDAPAVSNEAGKNSEADTLSTRKKRSDLKEPSEVVERSDGKDTPLAVPVKKRSLERRVTLVEKRNVPNPKKRLSRSASILIPERSHAEVKDELPGDLTLDPNLRLARSNEKVQASNSRAPRYRRDMSEDVEREKDAFNDEVDEPSNFLFPAREKPDCRMRRRRSRPRDRVKSVDRRKARKHPRHSRRHRMIRESSAEDDEHAREERSKRDMSLDEDAALEYKESFGGFQSESGGAGRFKRIKRSTDVS